MEVENKVRIKFVSDSVVWVSACMFNSESHCCTEISLLESQESKRSNNQLTAGIFARFLTLSTV